MNKKLEKGYFTTLITATLMIVGVPVAFAWTAAPSTPPKDNVEAPVNVSKNDQNKTGKLGLGGLAIFGKFQLIDGTQGVGKVLVSDADGKASWGTPLAGGGVAVGGSSAGSSQVLPGWPNIITCSKGSIKVFMNIHYVGYPNAGLVSYVAPTYSGTQPMISYDQNTKDYKSVIAQTTMGPDVAAAIETCKKNINNL